MSQPEITVSWTETRKVDGVVVPLARLVELMMEHAPDDLTEAIGEKLAEKGRTDIEEYAPIFRAISEYVAEQGIEFEYTDFESITAE